MATVDLDIFDVDEDLEEKLSLFDTLDPDDKLDQFSFNDNSGVVAPRNTPQPLLSRELGFNNGTSSADMFGTVPIGFTFGQMERGFKSFGVEATTGFAADAAVQFGERIVEKSLIDKVRDNDPIGPRDIRGVLSGQVVKAILGDDLEGVSERFIAWGNKARRLTDEFLVDNGLAMTEGEEPTFMFQLGSGVGSLASAIGLTVISKNPAAAASYFGLLQETSIYQEARKSGKDVNDAVFFAEVAGVAEAGLEFAGLDLIFKAGRKTLLKAIAAGSATEATQEALQTGAELTITELAEIRHTTAEQAFQQLIQSAAIGGLLGGGASGVFSAVQPAPVEVDTAPGAAFGAPIDPALDNIVSTDSEGNTTITPGVFTEAELDAIGSGEIGNIFSESFLDEVIENLGPELDIDADSKQDTPGLAVSSDTKTMKEKSAEIMDAMIQGVDINEAFPSEEKLAEFKAKQLDALDKSRAKGAEVVREGKLFALEQTEKELLGQIDELTVEGEAAFTEFADTQAEAIGIQEKGFDSSLSKSQLKKLEKQLEFELQADFQAQFDKTKKAQAIEKKRDKLEASLLKTQEELDTISQVGSNEVLDELRGQRANIRVGIDTAVKDNKALQKVIDKAATLGGKIAEEERKIVQKEFDKIIDEFGNSISPEARNRFRKRVKNIQTVAQLNKAVDKLLVDANIDINKTAKQKSVDAVNRILKKKRSTDGGKMDFLAQDMVNDMSEYTAEDAANITASMPPTAMTDTTIEMRLQYLNLLADKNSDARSWIIFQDNLQSIIDSGVTKFESERIARRAEEEARKEKAPRSVIKPVKKSGLSVNIVRYMKTFETIMQGSGLGRTIVAELIQMDINYRASMDALHTKLVNAVNTVSPQFLQELLTPTKEKNKLKFKTGNGNTISLTKGEAITVWMQTQNKRVRSFYTQQKTKEMTVDEAQKLMAYTEENLALISNFIGPEGKALGREMFRLYKESLSELQPIYRRIYGVSLPEVDFYSPLKRQIEGQEEDDPITFDATDNGANSIFQFLATPSALKQRKGGLKRIAQSDVLTTFMKYSMDTQWWINYRQWHSESIAIAKDSLVSQAIQEKIGPNNYNALIKHIDLMAMSKRHWAVENSNVLDQIRINMIMGQLALSPNMILKQSTSALTSLATVPPHTYGIALAKMMANPGKVLGILNKHDSFRLRGVRDQIELSEKGVASILKTLKGKQTGIDKVKQLSTMNIVFGDRIGFAVSVYTDYYHRTEVLGEDKESALNEAMKQGERTQQSQLPSQQTLVQKEGSSLERLMTMYSTSAVALVNMELNVVAKYKNGEATRAEVIRTWAVVHGVVNMLFTIVSNIGDDDPEKATANLIVGPIGSVPLIGSVATYMGNILASAIWDKVIRGEEMSIGGFRDDALVGNVPEELVRSTHKAMKVAADKIASGEDEPTTAELAEAIAEAVQYFTPLPIKKGLSIGEGVALTVGADIEGYENFEADDAILKSLGYTDYTIETRKDDDGNDDYKIVF